MIRKPLRPLAKILKVREEGGSTDAVERENLRLRVEEERDLSRKHASSRIVFIGSMFALGFFVIAARMAMISMTAPEEPRAAAAGNAIIGSRANIVDRNGRLMATNIETYSIYAHPHQMVDPARAAHELPQIFPELKEEKLLADFTGTKRFMWIRRQISPEQMQKVHDIGEPGLLFGPREARLYPNGDVAAHILGGAGYGNEGVNSAEILGVAGVEKYFDDFLRDPANEGAPLELSLDLTVQSAMEEVLAGGMTMMNAKGAAGIIIDIHTGEIMAMASLPDFDPNNRPRPLTTGDQSDSPLFNRAVQGVYELGSVYKIFAAAQAIDLGLVNANTELDTRSPLAYGRFRIRDFGNYGAVNTVAQVIMKSSNIGAARLGIMIGGPRQREFLSDLGLLSSPKIELVEASTSVPLVPRNWGELTTITASYGHGFSTSPVNLAAAYASVVNGGRVVRPTLLRQDGPQEGEQILKSQSSAIARDLLRRVVTEGTASFANVAGYEIGGKTGTADKPRPSGGYYDDKVIATFAGTFPARDPKYVFVVTLDEPVETSGKVPRRTAGWTAVPVAAEMVRRAAPLLGVRPTIETAALSSVSQSGH